MTSEIDGRGAGENRRLPGAVIFVTGANGGIGQALVQAFREAGAAEVIAGVRGGRAAPSGASQCRVDVTDADSVAGAAAAWASRVDILVNNAGVNGNGRIFAAGAAEAARAEIEVNYLGLLHTMRAFAPSMQARGRGVIVNILSLLAHVNLPLMATYSASKAAAHSLTQAARAELSRSGVRVCGIYPRMVDTAMSRHVAAPKLSPAELAGVVIAAIEEGAEDVYPGNAAEAYDDFREDPKAMERQFAARLPT